MVIRKTKGLERTRVSENSIFVFLQIAITGLLGIFNSILLVWGINTYYPFIGGEIYGRLGYIQTIVLIFTPFLYVGFLLTLTKKIAEHYAINDEFSKQKVKYTLQFALLLMSSVTLIFYFLFIFFIITPGYQFDPLNVNMPLYFSLFGLVWILNIISVISTGILQGFQKYRFVTYSNSVAVFFITISYLILAFTINLNLLTVTIVLLISELVKGLISLGYMMYLLKNYEILDVKMDLSSQQKKVERIDLMKYNVIFMLLSLFQIFIFYYDKVLIYFFLNSYTELAYYFIANYIFTFLFPISCAIFNALLPASSEQNILKNKDNLVKYVNLGSKYALYISVILAIFMATAISEVMPIVYGDFGRESIKYLPYFAIILIFETLFSPLGNVLIGINVRNYALIYGIRAVLNIILWPLLFSIFKNIISILVGSIISSFIWYLVCVIYLREYIHIKNLIKLTPKVLLPSCIIIGGYFLLYWMNFFASTIFWIFFLKIIVFSVFIGGTYVLFLAIMKGFSPEDLNILEKGIYWIPGARRLISILRKISGYA
ncbi:MAG: oligosaccharide flippase family protein [Promethearchaeota archaeon]